ncbi:uncharacterized protein NPIL_291381 [Nephila pilipes]|uniref:Gustatory receptor n=1 Tax=Nephila pilipes TaxID=299642 RepID=A0A8X6NH71_NEPPI|nr:uncharacterized protein NPIL_291381 [Nephila pilipes]
MEKPKINNCARKLDGSQKKINWLLKCFILIGIPFYDYSEIRKNDISSLIKFWLKICVEVFYTSFGVHITLYSSFGIRGKSCFLGVTTSAVTVVLLLLRFSIAFKRSQIIRLIDAVNKFKINVRKPFFKCKKHDTVIPILFHIGMPLAIGQIFLLFLIRNYDQLDERFKSNLLHYCIEDPVCVITIIPLYSGIHTLYSFVTPSLSMTLFYYIHRTYDKSLKHMILETHYTLLTNMSHETIERSMSAIIEATKVYRLIENVLSLSTFLMYLLVFINFLNIVAINVANFTGKTVALRTIGSIIVFTWTTGCFFHLTLKASNLVDVCNLWKNLKQDIIKNCIHKQTYPSDVVSHLLLFNETADLNLVYTGWGMFELDRSLLLAMVGAIVSYSVLLITI